jgi:hypothetical protein
LQVGSQTRVIPAKPAIVHTWSGVGVGVWVGVGVRVRVRVRGRVKVRGRVREPAIVHTT